MNNYFSCSACSCSRRALAAAASRCWRHQGGRPWERGAYDRPTKGGDRSHLCTGIVLGFHLEFYRILVALL